MNTRGKIIVLLLNLAAIGLLSIFAVLFFTRGFEEYSTINGAFILFGVFMLILTTFLLFKKEGALSLRSQLRRLRTESEILEKQVEIKELRSKLEEQKPD